MEQKVSDLSNYRTKLFSGIRAGLLKYTVDSLVLQGSLVIDNIKRERHTAFPTLFRTAFEMIENRDASDEGIACPDNIDKLLNSHATGKNER